MNFAEKIVAYMIRAGHTIFQGEGQINIVYVEGVNALGLDIPDLWDRFNDRRILITYQGGKPVIIYNAECTTEPGKAPTFSRAAGLRGGIFRIAFGQYLECWQVGFHKGRKDHPALVQVKDSTIYGHRDRDRNGLRTGDKIDRGSGVNQHGTRPGFIGYIVGFFSEGCLVVRHWADQISFMALVKTDPRYQADNAFKFSATVIPGDAMNAMFKSCPVSCGPGDWKKGGRCDLNGCYHI